MRARSHTPRSYHLFAVDRLNVHDSCLFISRQRFMTSGPRLRFQTCKLIHDWQQGANKAFFYYYFFLWCIIPKKKKKKKMFLAVLQAWPRADRDRAWPRHGHSLVFHVSLVSKLLPAKAMIFVVEMFRKGNAVVIFEDGKAELLKVCFSMSPA